MQINPNKIEYTLFKESMNSVFENELLISDLYRKRPYKDNDEILTIAKELIGKLAMSHKLKIINSHSVLGKPKNNKISISEQGELDSHTLKTLGKLNTEYFDKFGFIFVEFVNGRSLDNILPIIKRRLSNTRDEEISNNLKNYLLISQSRLNNIYSFK